MAILENVQIPAASTTVVTGMNRRPFGGVAVDRPRAKVWGNFGIMENGEFIPVPLGAPIDTMEPASVTGSNVGAVRLNTKKNKVLAALQAIGNAMSPGETKFIDLKFQLRRVSDDLEIVREDNELDVDGIVSMLSAKATPELKAVEPVEPEEETQPSKADLQAQVKALQAILKRIK